jgi:hypothetical protein
MDGLSKEAVFALIKLGEGISGMIYPPEPPYEDGKAVIYTGREFIRVAPQVFEAVMPYCEKSDIPDCNGYRLSFDGRARIRKGLCSW